MHVILLTKRRNQECALHAVKCLLFLTEPKSIATVRVRQRAGEAQQFININVRHAEKLLNAVTRGLESIVITPVTGKPRVLGSLKLANIVINRFWQKDQKQNTVPESAFIEQLNQKNDNAQFVAKRFVEASHRKSIAANNVRLFRNATTQK